MHVHTAAAGESPCEAVGSTSGHHATAKAIVANADSRGKGGYVMLAEALSTPTTAAGWGTSRTTGCFLPASAH